MGRPMWIIDLIKKSYPSRFLLAKATNVPILGAAFEHVFFKNDDIIYLPQDGVVIDVNENIDKPKQIAVPSKVLEHFIEQASTHYIMNTCICREAGGCENYPVDMGCLFLGDAALQINPEQGRTVTKDQALEHLERCREANLVHLIGRSKLDTVWLGVGPGRKLVTICNCCPCCCLWRILPHLNDSINSMVNRMKGVEVAITDQCIGCGTCLDDVCFVNAIHEKGDCSAIDSDKCVGCGRCVNVCPNKAIALSIDDDLFLEKTIDQLSPLFDL